jgi:hypothetical protein
MWGFVLLCSARRVKRSSGCRQKLSVSLSQSHCSRVTLTAHCSLARCSCCVSFSCSVRRYSRCLLPAWLLWAERQQGLVSWRDDVWVGGGVSEHGKRIVLQSAPTMSSSCTDCGFQKENEHHNFSILSSFPPKKYSTYRNIFNTYDRYRIDASDRDRKICVRVQPWLNDLLVTYNL